MVHPSAAGNTYMVSDSEDISTPALIRKIAEAIQKSARLFSFPPHLLRLAGHLTGKSESLNRLLNSLSVDFSKIRSELGWRPEESFETGLQKTIRWYLDNNDWVQRVVSGDYQAWVKQQYG